MVEVIPVEPTVEPALAALPEDVQAVFVAPLLQLSPGEFNRLVSGLIERKLPSYSVVGTSEVKRGHLVGISQDFDISRLARRLAINVQRILLGEDSCKFSVMFSRGERREGEGQEYHEVGLRTLTQESTTPFPCVLKHPEPRRGLQVAFPVLRHPRPLPVEERPFRMRHHGQVSAIG